MKFNYFFQPFSWKFFRIPLTILILFSRTAPGTLLEHRKWIFHERSCDDISSKFKFPSFCINCDNSFALLSSSFWRSDRSEQKFVTMQTHILCEVNDKFLFKYSRRRVPSSFNYLFCLLNFWHSDKLEPWRSDFIFFYQEQPRAGKADTNFQTNFSLIPRQTQHWCYFFSE